MKKKKYADPYPHNLVYDILETGSMNLLGFWLTRCAAAGKIIQPEVIPVLLDAGKKYKSLQSVVNTCCGKRGRWLAQFNEEWNDINEIDEEEAWQTGTMEQRKLALAQIRKSNAAKGRILLQQSWSNENAAAKAEFIQQLAEQADEEDLPWLEELLHEKSAKVKDKVLQLLQTIPSSSIVERYWRVLEQSVKWVESKGILGMGGRSHLEISLGDVDAAIFKIGIEQLPSQVNVTEEHFIINQLISLVPPERWEKHFNLSAEKIISLFWKNEKHKLFVPAFGLAASRFKNLHWLRTLLAIDDNSMYSEAFRLLPQEEAEAYALRFLSIDEHAAAILHSAQHFAQEWGMEFSGAVLRYAAKYPHHYNKAYYSQVIHLLPVSIRDELEKYVPKEEQLKYTWSNVAEHIKKLLTLKQQTIKAFNV